MFQFDKDKTPRQKCYFTKVTGVSYVDADQSPTKRKPYSMFHEHPFSHTMNLILPQEVYELVQQHLDSEAARLHYSRVFLSLKDILEGEFFNEYIKKGNIALLAEGRPGVDNHFSVNNGMLRLEVDKPTYERCGLVGKPIPHGGRKHIKARFLIEYNLRLPPMQHGKKGFERLKYAANNVLTQSLSWLLVDLSTADPPTSDPLAKHHPKPVTIPPHSHPLVQVLTPPLLSTGSTSTLPTSQSATADLFEYLSLISLTSPRLASSDRTDPFLSRYQVPDLDDDTAEGPVPQDLVCVRWHGFITPQFVTQLWMAVRKEAKGGWAAMQVGCFGGEGYTVLDLGRDGIGCWECK